MKNILIYLSILLICTNLILAQDDQKVSMPTIAVLPKPVNGKDALTLLKDGNSIQSKAANAIGQILKERLLTVIEPEQAINNFESMRASMPGLNSDNNAMIAAVSGVDIYFEFVVDIIKVGPAQKATVDIKVYEAATALGLAEGGGTSDAIMPPDNDAGSLTKIAARNGMERILENVRQYWKQVPVKGKPIKLMINFSNTEVNAELPNGQYIDETIEDWIKANSKSYKIGYSTANTIDFTYIYIDYIKYDSPKLYGRELRKLFDKTLGMKIDLQSTGKLIRIQEK